MVCGDSCIVRGSTGGSETLTAFSLSILSSRNEMTECRKSAPCAVTLSANHLSRLRYSRREARAATSNANLKGRTSNNASKIYHQVRNQSKR